MFFCINVNQSLNEISKVPEVLSYCCLHKVRDAGVTMVSAVYDFLYLFGEAFGQVNGVVSVLPASHSMIIQPLLVNKVYICIISILYLAKCGWLSHGKPKTKPKFASRSRWKNESVLFSTLSFERKKYYCMVI